MAKPITTIVALKLLIAQMPNLYVRWSRGPRYDKTASHDYLSGGTHAGLSAVAVSPDWATDDEWLARRLTEYGFLRMKDSAITCYIYQGVEIAKDSDGYSSIQAVCCAGRLSQKLITQLRAMLG